MNHWAETEIKKMDLDDDMVTILHSGFGEYSQLSISDNGELVAFIADFDTLKYPRPYELYLSQKDSPAQKVADEKSDFLLKNWMISQFRKPTFSKDGNRMFFGVAPKPLLEDTTKLKEEKPVVEVWSTSQGRLYTQQKVRANSEKKRSYLAITDIIKGKTFLVGGKDLPYIVQTQDKLENFTLGYDDTKYLKYISWEGSSYKDLFLVNLKDGSSELIATKLAGNASLSPTGKFGYWYDMKTRNYFTINLLGGEIINISSQIGTPLADETNDRPNDPSPYGIAGWAEKDEFVLIYDRFDMWMVDPLGIQTPINITNGRNAKRTFRYIKLDQENQHIDISSPNLFSVFDNISKENFYLRIHNGKSKILFGGKVSLGRRVWKAEKSDDIVFTQETFDIFPNLIHSNIEFDGQSQISNANPQQSEYNWGQGELFSWINHNGTEMTGMVFKPEDFDPEKKYPLLVNFYEKK